VALLAGFDVLFVASTLVGHLTSPWFVFRGRHRPRETNDPAAVLFHDFMFRGIQLSPTIEVAVKHETARRE
jgi:hypothetical protein